MMNDCPDGEMRDLLPGYVHGTLPAADRETVRAHVANCEDCTAEAELIATAARSFAAPIVDLDRILNALPPAPRRSQVVPAHRQFSGDARRIAAAIGIIAVGAFSVVAIRARFLAAANRAGAVLPAPGPHVRSGTTLVAAAPSRGAGVESPARVRAPRAAPQISPAAISFGGGLSDLTDDQLDTLLGELDDIQALPSPEPETHVIPILPPGDGGHGAR